MVDGLDVASPDGRDGTWDVVLDKLTAAADAGGLWTGGYRPTRRQLAHTSTPRTSPAAQGLNRIYTNLTVEPPDHVATGSRSWCCGRLAGPGGLATVPSHDETATHHTPVGPPRTRPDAVRADNAPTLTRDPGTRECASLKWPHLEPQCWLEVAPPSTYLSPYFRVRLPRRVTRDAGVESEIESGAVRTYPT